MPVVSRIRSLDSLRCVQLLMTGDWLCGPLCPARVLGRRRILGARNDRQGTVVASRAHIEDSHAPISDLAADAGLDRLTHQLHHLAL